MSNELSEHGDMGGGRVNRPVWIVIGLGILIALGGAAFLLTASKERGDLNGFWTARMQQPGRPPYNLRLQLQAEGARLTGTASFPEGSSELQEGAVDGERIRFSVRRNGDELRFQGVRNGRVIELTAASASGGPPAIGVARRSD